MYLKQIEVPLSRLIPSQRNPRRVKPSREAHRRLVALIRSQGLLQPLVIRHAENKPKYFSVIAGERRLLALREIHAKDGATKIPCILRDVDNNTADALSLGENFGREAMHPLDEAEAFASLATSEGKDAKAISSEFGVTEHYVRQRMKLATLADVVKAAYRGNEIDTATAEAFTAVPEDRQLEVWKEVNGHPRHADHIRNIIANDWIDSSLAIFDKALLSESVISRDLFGDRELIERKAFMEAQSQALETSRQGLADEGWKEVVVGRREDVQDRLYSMNTPERQFDKDTSRELAKIAKRKEKLEEMVEKTDQEDEERLTRLQERFEELERQEQQIVKQAPVSFSEETKAQATAFLILDPDGKVHQEYRIPRRTRSSEGQAANNGGGPGVSTESKAPTSDELSDKQLAVTFTHQALAVRQALMKNQIALKRVLAIILHDKIRSEALSIRHEANGTTLHASAGEGFTSSAYDALQEQRKKFDPFVQKQHVEDDKAYGAFSKLSANRIDALIDLLTVECITAHMQRRTELVWLLAAELKVNIRDFWRPDSNWLSSYQKIQLAHLVTELKGSVHAPAPERKKSELVKELATLFTDAAEGKFDDKQLAKRVNEWLPSNMREAQKS